MNLEKYLAQFKSNSKLYLIGPLYDEEAIFKEPVIFVDGGGQYQKSEEGFIVGDGDSSEIQMDEKLSEEKDISDLGYALSQIEGFSELLLLGFLGKRKDHELMNLAEVHRFLKGKSQVKASFDNKVIALSTGEWKLDIMGTFSLFAFESIELTMSGECKYSIDTTLKELSSHGLSNEGNGEIVINTNGPVFVWIKP